jgi:hypothetical protein
MRFVTTVPSTLVVLCLVAVGAACGSSGGSDKSPSGGGGPGSGDDAGGTGPGLFGDDGGTGGTGTGPGGGACPAGLQCNVSCSGGATTTISGVVYDPAHKNPLYNVAVYVPGAALEPLPKGVPTGGDACSCAALFKSGAVVSTATGVDGSFKLTNAPVGSQVPLVLQIGKWRKLVTINVTACQDNPQAKGSLALPSTVAAGDTNDNMPDIAVTTGTADTLECLMHRIGLPTSEYVAGAGGSGHIHVFAGGATSGGGGGGSHVGGAEMPGMTGAPAAYQSFWDSTAHMMPYDITLLSCEGGETYKANPPALEAYLNAGGRVFASHYHYAWFSGPMDTQQSYSAPADWGNSLASWTAGSNTLSDPTPGTVVQTLNGSSAPFPKGQALYQWLGVVGALGQHSVPSSDLSIYTSRLNANVGPSNKASQPWITVQSQQPTEYFSFDTPVNAPASPDGGAPEYCGRAVFSDLHVGGDPSTKDSMAPPDGCSSGDLSPQEKALEFMLFDLSSCVIPDTVAPPSGGVPPGGPVK